MYPEVKILGDAIIDGVVYRACPHCKKVKSLDDFGLRRIAGRIPGERVVITNQSWCRVCRNK